MTQGRRNIFKRLIEKYIEGRLSHSEERVLDDFLEQKVDQTQWDHLQMGDKDQVFQQISSNIAGRTHKKRISFDYKVYAAAASVALLIGVLGFTEFKSKDPIRFTTATAIDSLLLEDGTKIVLSPHSILEYPEDFDDNFREVNLIKGNAFFQVQRDSLRPFRIDQDNLITEVLGTSFNIRATPRTTEVDVKTGVVAVSNDANQRVVIRKNEKVVFHRTDNRLEGVRKSNLTKWYTSNVSLTNITLLEFSKFLENRYGYKLTMENRGIDQKRIIIHIAENDTIQEVVEQLQYITDLKFKIETNEIKVYQN